MSFGRVELLRQRPRDRWSRQVAEVAFCSSSWTSEQPLQDFPHNLVRAALRASWQICPIRFLSIMCMNVVSGCLVLGKRRERPRDNCLYCPEKCPKHLLN